MNFPFFHRKRDEAAELRDRLIVAETQVLLLRDIVDHPPSVRRTREPRKDKASVVRPRYAVLENVAALLSRGLDRVLGELAALGYDAEWHCVPAAYVGARHIRDRVWIVAEPTGQRQHARPYVDAVVLERFRESCTAWGEDRFIPGTQLCDDWSPPDRLFEQLDDGSPTRLDELGACGNAVVPQIPELLGHAILESMRVAA